MKHLFIPYELAVKLKKLGFDEDCFGGFDAYKELRFDYVGMVKNSHFNMPPRNHVAAPLYQQVVDWLRDKHEIIVDPIPVLSKGHDKAGKFTAIIIVKLILQTIDVGYYDEYYEALNAAIEKAIQLISIN